jgi:threonylcarbamoyladenosine tRNA methylthiotransferase MtaB
MNEQLEELGYIYNQSDGPADILVVNTCTVTKIAEKKSIRALNRLIKKNSQAKVIVSGCLLKDKPELFDSRKDIDLLLDIEDNKFLSDKIGQGSKSLKKKSSISSFAEHNRAFVKIQDGCENFCSYCIVAYIRGKPKSKKPKEIIAEIKALQKRGFKEIVLTGINLGLFGKDLNEDIDLAGLIKRLTLIFKGRIRLSSININYINNDLVDLLKEGSICPHLHIPLQSGDNGVLKRMNRKYSIEKYLNKLDFIRKQVKNIKFTTDVIVGFPNESQRAFKNTLEAVKKAGFLKIHVFRYSDRAGTKSFGFNNKVDEDVKIKRAKELIELSEKKSEEIKHSLIGQESQVLVESKEYKGFLSGYSEDYIRVCFKGSKNLKNNFQKVRLVKVCKDYMMAERA